MDSTDFNQSLYFFDTIEENEADDSATTGEEVDKFSTGSIEETPMCTETQTPGDELRISHKDNDKFVSARAILDQWSSHKTRYESNDRKKPLDPTERHNVIGENSSSLIDEPFESTDRVKNNVSTSTMAENDESVLGDGNFAKLDHLSEGEEDFSTNRNNWNKKKMGPGIIDENTLSIDQINNENDVHCSDEDIAHLASSTQTTSDHVSAPSESIPDVKQSLYETKEAYDDNEVDSDSNVKEEPNTIVMDSSQMDGIINKTCSDSFSFSEKLSLNETESIQEHTPENQKEASQSFSAHSDDGTTLIKNGHQVSVDQTRNNFILSPKSPLNDLVVAATNPGFQTFLSDAAVEDLSSPNLLSATKQCLSFEGEKVISYQTTHKSDNLSDFTISNGQQVVSPLASPIDYESNSNDECSTSSSVTTSSNVFLIFDKDSGKTYDIREMERSEKLNFETNYSIFPSKSDLIEVHNRRISGGSSFSEESSSSREKKNPLGPLKRMKANKKDSSSSKNHVEDSRISGDGSSGGKDELKKSRLKSLRSKLKKKKKKEIQSNVDEISSSSISSSVASMKKSKSPSKTSPQEYIPKNTLNVKCVGKSINQSDFNPLLLIQSFPKAHKGPIWCTAFNINGRYLATGGMDGNILLWKVSPSKDDNQTYEKYVDSKNEGDVLDKDSEWIGFRDFGQDEGSDRSSMTAPPPLTSNTPCEAFGIEVQLLSKRPFQQYTDHTRDIVDLSWSDTDFLISASLDKTVRLFHPSRSICLKLFRHPDLVTSVAFHPTEDKYFVSGGFDKKLRVWDIPEGRVKEWAQAPDYISVVRYIPDESLIAAGIINGMVLFYQTQGLKYYTQISCKNRHSNKGKKVTGISFLSNLSDDKFQDKSRKMPKILKAKDKFSSNRLKEMALITTNDSRLRLVGLNDFCVKRKYKGYSNSSLQIKAKFSESGDFIISGSESGSCTIWNTATKTNPLQISVKGIHNYDKIRTVETFEATKADPPIITDASFFPGISTKTAIISSGLFPTLPGIDHITHDMTSASILTCDYEGTIRVFLRRSTLDSLYHAVGPNGHIND